MADQVLYSGVACITDLMVKEGLINLDFADVRAIMRGMGKAMMGTGEASGEKRANRAAEAAIANPLLDDVSMKGARGLLISITGGRDLTLYELDEAATRIREEVDSEANIILGATFDETMEGTIRVSVVATGIDQPAIAEAPLSTTEQRIAEVAERLRAEARARAAVPPVTSLAPVRTAMPDPTPAARAAEIVAQAAMAEPAPPAPVAHEDVVLTQTQPRAASFEPLPAAEPAAPAVSEAPAAPFIPPAPERVLRPTRMPRVDELPVPAQKQLRAARGEEAAPGEKMNLLRRLATVGFGRRDDASTAPAEPAIAAPAPVRQLPFPPQTDAKRAPAAPSFRPAQGNLDGQGRVLPARNVDDDQLEIPAFLRRHSN